MSAPQIIRTPGGEQLVVLLRADYEALVKSALCEAEAIIEAADQVKLSERDNLRVVDMLENPPPANARLAAAARAMPQSA